MFGLVQEQANLEPEYACIYVSNVVRINVSELMLSNSYYCLLIEVFDIIQQMKVSNL